ncbi:ATP-binding protein, partial [Acinetobacter baumannii]|nr:ATP-binding protein [Acinetobacter baumannii]EKW1173731.1 ATP-binding protein [Acinetobacter baumannii]
MNEKLDNAIKIPFKVSARTAKLIGLENFSNEEGAIVELVKNTYDADAHDCILIFDLKTKKEKQINKDGKESTVEKIDREKSYICIIDNGIGMNDEIIENQWMTIGTDHKLYEHTTEKSRVKTGAKGIGRFALNRLGMLTNLLSLPNKLEVTNGEETNKNVKELSERENIVSFNNLAESGSSITEKEDDSIDTKFVENKENKCFEWTVDWKEFDRKGATVSDIEAILSSKVGLNLKQDLLNRFSSYPQITELLNNIEIKNGTVIDITELNDDWSEEKLKKLFSNLEMLLPPVEQSNFNINLFLLSNLDEFGKVKRAYYDDYDYKLKATYGRNGNDLLEIEIIRNELDVNILENNYNEIFQMPTMQNSPYQLEDFKKKKIQWDMSIRKLLGDEINEELLSKIGKFDFTLYFLKNTVSDDKEDLDSLKKYPYKNFNSSNRKTWLKKFGGIKIFRDDFRIRPYGENGDDWLRLGERQAQSPGGVGQRLGGYRIRPNQVAGTINISRLDNLSFQDKSGREGLIENDEFELFKNIIKEIISIFEKDRNTIMYNLSEVHKKKNIEASKLRKAKEDAERIISEKENKNEISSSQSGEELPQDSQNSKETQENMADAFLILEKESGKKDEELRLLRSLASVGLVISSFAHEVRSLRAKLIPRTDHLISELKNFLNEEDLVDIDLDDNPSYMINLMREDDFKLKHWLDYSLNTLKVDKRERKKLDFSNYFKIFKTNWIKA